MANDEENLKDEKKREAFKNFILEPIQKIVTEVRNAGDEAEADAEVPLPRSYDNVEISRLLVLSNVIKDFDEDLVKQWVGIQGAYRRDFPNNLEDFSFFLNGKMHEVEIEAAKHRYGESILKEFSEQDLKEINDFYESDFGKKTLRLNELMRVELRNERTTISKNIGGRLEMTATEIRQRKKS